MARPNLDKIRINITLDKELNEILEKRNINKSALISSLLWKFLGLENNKSQVTSLNSLVSKSPPTGIRTQVPGSKGLRDLRQETCDKRNPLILELFSVYKTHKNTYYDFIYSNFSQNYCDDISRYLKEFFKNKNLEKSSFKEIIEETNLSIKYISRSIRNFLNYCEENEFLDINSINEIRSKVKFKKPSNDYNTYIPSSKDIHRSREKMRTKSHNFLILYDLMIETGCRFTELKHFILNFKENNVEEWGDLIVLYRNFYLRGKKSSFYLFYTSKTHNKLMKVINEIDTKTINSFENIISHDKNIVSLKYLRKYNFTLLIEAGVSFEIANFIQGRTSQNVGFNHYLSKKVIAVREYKKANFEFN